jgi:lysozyme
MVGLRSDIMAITRRQLLAAAPVVTLGAATVTGIAQSTGTYLKGIDISKWQGTINWNAVRNAGTTFAFCKATEGLNYTDPNFATNWPAIKSAGIIRGAYHFGRPGVDAIAQADHFVNTVKPIKGDLPLVLDFEAYDNKTPSQVWTWAQKFVSRVKDRIGKPPIIYTGFYFWKDRAGNPTSSMGCPLWLAAYQNSTTGLIPPAWATWSFWQYTSTGTVSGVTGNVDRNYFNGSLAQLKALTLP